MHFILASASPRRRELMEMLGVEELVIRPAKGEETADPTLPPAQYVMALSAHKAREAAAEAQPGDVVLVAGKGHETYQDVMGVKHHFDDREELRACF